MPINEKIRRQCARLCVLRPAKGPIMPMRPIHGSPSVSIRSAGSENSRPGAVTRAAPNQEIYSLARSTEMFSTQRHNILTFPVNARRRSEEETVWITTSPQRECLLSAV